MFDEKSLEKYFLPEREKIVWQSQSDPEFLQQIFDTSPSAFLEEYHQDKKNLERAKTTVQTLEQLLIEIEEGNITEEENIFLSGLLGKVVPFSQHDTLQMIHQMILDAQKDVQTLEDIITKREKILDTMHQ